MGLSLSSRHSHQVGELHGPANRAVRKSRAMEIISFACAVPAHFMEAVRLLLLLFKIEHPRSRSRKGIMVVEALTIPGTHAKGREGDL